MSGRAAKLVRRAVELIAAEGRLNKNLPLEKQYRPAKRHFKTMTAKQKGELRAYVERHR